MGWKTAWLGSETRIRRRVDITLVSLGAGALALIGMSVDFVPAPALHGMHVTLLFLVIGVIGTAGLLRHRDRHGRMHVLLDKGFPKFLFFFCGMPVLLGFVSWCVLVKALPWAWTRAFGGEFRESHIMKTYYVSSRRTCEYRLEGGPMERAFPRYLCVSETFYHRHPEEQVPVVLVGRRSPFGASIVHIESGR
ncbi:hypothetical protein [Pseudoxanthomonas sp. PXM02]|uniref:hypothetical protein n=1 Tax=Pseudoxanthomonas sp. PXM02 TaxID=2769294 RepID=UPI0017812AA1|nr:hypothetical protein [Pseudoxanthomonas sp. PXM02]MBD9478274.1 hypothetical protein [Pseudoxanthomonas sp. PXM02]